MNILRFLHQKFFARKNESPKCFELSFVDVRGNIYIQRLCCKDTTLPHVIRAAWKSLYEGKHVAATALVDTIHEVEAI